MAIYQFPYLEMMITRLCNMHCDGCDSYSNLGITSQVSLDEATEWLQGWSRRIYPKVFRFIGGETTLHKDLIPLIRLARSVWPGASRWMVTNGHHLHRHPDLGKVLQETGTGVHLSFHSSEPAYVEKTRQSIALMRKWERDYGVPITIKDHRQFYRTYRGVGNRMAPFEDNDPVASWKACLSSSCKNLMYNRLWKCGVIMALPSALAKVGLLNDPKWSPYVNYTGIGLDATDDQLFAFLTKGPEDICGMCPAKPAFYSKDISNINFLNNEAPYVAWQGPQVDLDQFLASIQPAP